ncbi:MAG: hypothetical protein PW786_13065 [Arachidicoccus sp.]|nr:hypothetical protein [Arachidicoccus sp.]
MDTSDDMTADLSPLEQRRAALRALSDDIMDIIKDLPKPTTWLEGDRAMRCLGTADRVTVQLFRKVKAHIPAKARHIPAYSAAPACEPEAPFVSRFEDDDVENVEETDDGAALDIMLDDMEALLDAIDRGETPAPVKLSAKCVATGHDTPYHTLAQALNRGRDLLNELATAPP